MAPRITYRRQVSYNTINNKIRKVKTPGGRTMAQYLDKKPNPRICGEPGCRKPLTGLPILRPNKFKLLKKRENRVSRAYGGSLCSNCVKNRIIRAFLTEEVKIVKKVMSQKKEKK